MFNVHCQGWRRMWITWSCDGGTDKTTAVIPSRSPTTKCSAKPGKMKSKDIPLDGGSINILCKKRQGAKC